jgi:adenine/guanine phosphoribosyltransferase-like PRPP-binding protein
MVKKDENYKDETFEISKVQEIKNQKYVIVDDDADTGNTESNG